MHSEPPPPPFPPISEFNPQFSAPEGTSKPSPSPDSAFTQQLSTQIEREENPIVRALSREHRKVKELSEERAAMEAELIRMRAENADMRAELQEYFDDREDRRERESEARTRHPSPQRAAYPTKPTSREPEMANMMSAVTQLANTIQQLVAHPAPMQQVPPSRRSPNANTPTKYDGSRDTLPAFKRTAKVYMELKPEEFRSERAKILFVLGFITEGTAAEWANQQVNLVTSRANLYTTYEQFETALQSAFGDPDAAATARHEMDGMFQGKTEFPVFLARFRNLAGRTGHSETTHIHFFTRALHPDIMNPLHRLRPPPATLEDWYRAAQDEENNRVRAMRQAEAYQAHSKPQLRTAFRPAFRQSATASGSAFRPFPNAPRAPQTNPQRPTSVAAEPRAGSGKPQPRSAATTPTTTPKPRGLCHGCNSLDHYIAKCPDKHKAKVRLLEILAAIDDDELRAEVEEDYLLEAEMGEENEADFQESRQ